MPSPTRKSSGHGFVGKLRGRTHRNERGSSLVEFALVFPVFLLFIIGIIEFSFVLAQNNEIKHLAREGARIAAVENVGSQAIANELCGQLGLIDRGTFEFQADGLYANGSDPLGSAGSIGEVIASAEIRTFTGWFTDMFAAGASVRSSANFYVEAPQENQAAWWSNTGSTGHMCS